MLVDSFACLIPMPLHSHMVKHILGFIRHKVYIHIACTAPSGIITCNSMCNSMYISMPGVAETAVTADG